MKVTAKDPVFQPVSVTFETRDELLLFESAMKLVYNEGSTVQVRYLAADVLEALGKLPTT